MCESPNYCQTRVNFPVNLGATQVLSSQFPNISSNVQLLMKGPASNSEICCASENGFNVRIYFFTFSAKKCSEETPKPSPPPPCSRMAIHIPWSSLPPSCHRYESNL